MMKKLLFILVVGIILAIPVATFAGYAANSAAKRIGGAECTYIIGNDGKSYPSDCNVRIDKFTDQSNVCYVAVGGTGNNIPAISCVRDEP
jgi:acyl-coenzyme A synthetase/AMP-(fatty) acid ligase